MAKVKRCFTIDYSTYLDFKNACERNGCKMSSVTNILIEQWLEKERKYQGVKDEK
jgi:hypothetical protein|tara:strand:+ start:209 stop:373 length:165 start_codon:yes stop_codon:yes gene_type:complete